MDKFSLIVINTAFVFSFVIFAIMAARMLFKNFISSFVGGSKTVVKHAEQIQRLIDEYKEG